MHFFWYFNCNFGLYKSIEENYGQGRSSYQSSKQLVSPEDQNIKIFFLEPWNIKWISGRVYKNYQNDEHKTEMLWSLQSQKQKTLENFRAKSQNCVIVWSSYCSWIFYKERIWCRFNVVKKLWSIIDGKEVIASLLSLSPFLFLSPRATTLWIWSSPD